MEILNGKLQEEKSTDIIYRRSLYCVQTSKNTGTQRRHIDDVIDMALRARIFAGSNTV